jgi:hypothetical protein
MTPTLINLTLLIYLIYCYTIVCLYYLFVILIMYGLNIIVYFGAIAIY